MRRTVSRRAKREPRQHRDSLMRNPGSQEGTGPVNKHGYPGVEDIGRRDNWLVPVDDGLTTISATLIGTATTYKDRHTHSGDVVPDDRPCPHCRWFEVRLFADDRPGRSRTYLVHTGGITSVPGEHDRGRIQQARDAYEAVYVLSSPGRGPHRFLSAPVREALGLAAKNGDEEIARVLREW